MFAYVGRTQTADSAGFDGRIDGYGHGKCKVSVHVVDVELMNFLNKAF